MKEKGELEETLVSDSLSPAIGHLESLTQGAPLPSGDSSVRICSFGAADISSYQAVWGVMAFANQSPPKWPC